jgi:hypothetical protein
MRIRIIGAGKVGGGLGKLWVRAGHQVFFSSRHPNRLKVLVEEAGSGAYSGNVADAALFGDVILFSPNFWGVDTGVFSLVMLAGATRLALGATDVKSIRAAVISAPLGMFNPGTKLAFFMEKFETKNAHSSARGSDAFKTGFLRTLDAKPRRGPDRHLAGRFEP